MDLKAFEILDHWIAARELSERQIAHLQSLHEGTMKSLPEIASMAIADSHYCEAAELPPGTCMPVVIASVLDYVGPINASHSQPGTPERTVELLGEMATNHLIEDNEANEALNALGHGN